MSAVNAVRFLGTGSDDQALALKMFMNSYKAAPRTSIFLYDNPVIHKETVGAGKSFQFLMESDIPTPEDYTPGAELMGQIFAVDEGTITTDKYIVSHHWIPRDQLNWSHFDPRTGLAARQRRRIEREIDRRIFITACKAARATSAVTKDGVNIHYGGNRVTRSGTSVTNVYAASSTGAANFRADLRQLARLMDEDNIDETGRQLFFNPNIRESLMYDNTAALWSRDYDPSNMINTRKIQMIDGFSAMGFPNRTSNGGPLPSEDLVHANSKFTGNFSVKTGDTTNGEPVAVALCRGPEGQCAVGMVEFEAPQHTAKYYDEKMSWLFMTFTLNGIGQMYPYCAGVIEAVSNS